MSAPTEAERVAALQREAAAAYAAAQAAAQQQAAADQLAFARIHGNEQAGNR